MDGRRVTHSAPRRNPLYVLFLCLIAAVFVLLVVVIVLSAKLGATQKALDSAKEQIEELQKSTVQTGDVDPALPDGTDEPEEPTVPDDSEPDAPNEPEEPDEPTQPEPDNKNLIGWLDLTDHGYLAVKPASVYDRYYTYYAAEAVNLRSGPATNYTRLLTIERGTKVEAAAKDGQWSFVLVNGKYGWVKTEFLSTSPVEVTPGNLTQ